MRNRLAGLVAATMSLVLIAFLVPIGILLWREAEQRAVAAASVEVQTLAALVAVDEAAAVGSLAGRAEDAPIISIFMPDGTVEGASAERTPSVQLAQLGQAFTADAAGGVELLVPVQGLAGGTAVIRSYLPDSQLHDGVWQSVLTLGLLALALFAVGVGLADRLGQRLVGSVSALAATADRLAGGDLNARVAPSGPPELRHVGAAFNHLASRITEQFDAVRSEVADLAHRLRTPVTALRLDADSLRDPDERARLGVDVDDLSRMVDEVIRTARRPVREGARAIADLAAVARSRADFWAPLAEDTGRRLDQMIAAGPVPVGVAAGDLEAVLDALLGNVFAHTPDGTRMRVVVEPVPTGGGRLIVEDSGPGLVGAGYGIPGQRDQGAGTGLGLDIVRRTAEAAAGGVRLGQSNLGGALVEAYFGPP